MGNCTLGSDDDPAQFACVKRCMANGAFAPECCKPPNGPHPYTTQPNHVSPVHNGRAWVWARAHAHLPFATQSSQSAPSTQAIALLSSPRWHVVQTCVCCPLNSPNRTTLAPPISFSVPLSPRAWRRAHQLIDACPALGSLLPLCFGVDFWD